MITNITNKIKHQITEEFDRKSGDYETVARKHAYTYLVSSSGIHVHFFMDRTDSDEDMQRIVEDAYRQRDIVKWTWQYIDEMPTPIVWPG